MLEIWVEKLSVSSAVASAVTCIIKRRKFKFYCDFVFECVICSIYIIVVYFKLLEIVIEIICVVSFCFAS